MEGRGSDKWDGHGNSVWGGADQGVSGPSAPAGWTYNYQLLPFQKAQHPGLSS